MQGHVVGLVTLDFVLRVFLARMMHISFVNNVLSMHFDDAPTNTSSL